ncbi:MAG: two-component sensor histidine kinase, partial [Desulfobulbaceae bacterium]|nr:two-component sensor histidine kinase [Desulfobulbaceae bacterium]
AEILGKRLKSVAPGNDHLANIIVEETSRLDATVKEFLDFARPQTVKPALVRINDILSKALLFMEPEFDKQNVILKNELDQDLDPVMADRELLYRAFLNILVNGIQAMPDGGTMMVATRRSRSDKGAVTVSISDTGIGMSQETKKRIFNPFFTEKDSGTGLGLAIVKIIIDNHCGEIFVKSEEKKGTTFTITIGGKECRHGFDNCI